MIDKYLKNWLIKADNDLKMVEHELVLPQKKIVKDNVCFHCQQAVEKYLKAFLLYSKIDIKRTHNIEYLLEQCIKKDKEFENIEIRELSSFGVDFRYPDDFYIPTMKEVLFYSKLARRIKKLVLKKLKEKNGHRH